MKWPWVSREQVDAVERARAMQVTYFEKVVDDLRHDSAFLQRQNNDLLERLLSLKMAGAVEVPKAPDVPRGTSSGAEPDELLDLIDEKASENPRIRRMMLRQLAKDRRKGKSDDEIASAILNGVPTEGVPE